jgi:hypothetical protein
MWRCTPLSLFGLAPYSTLSPFTTLSRLPTPTRTTPNLDQPRSSDSFFTTWLWSWTRQASATGNWDDRSIGPKRWSAGKFPDREWNFSFSGRNVRRSGKCWFRSQTRIPIESLVEVRVVFGMVILNRIWFELWGLYGECFERERCLKLRLRVFLWSRLECVLNKLVKDWVCPIGKSAAWRRIAAVIETYPAKPKHHNVILDSKKDEVSFPAKSLKVSESPRFQLVFQLISQFKIWRTYLLRLLCRSSSSKPISIPIPQLFDKSFQKVAGPRCYQRRVVPIGPSPWNLDCASGLSVVASRLFCTVIGLVHAPATMIGISIPHKRHAHVVAYHEVSVPRDLRLCILEAAGIIELDPALWPPTFEFQIFFFFLVAKH